MIAMSVIAVLAWLASFWFRKLEKNANQAVEKSEQEKKSPASALDKKIDADDWRGFKWLCVITGSICTISAVAWFLRSGW